MSKKHKEKQGSFYLLVDYDTDSGSNVQLFYKIGNDDDEYVKDVSIEDIPSDAKIYRSSFKDHVLLFNQKAAKSGKKKKAFMKVAGGKPSVISGLRPKESYITNIDRVYLHPNEKKNRVAPVGIMIDKYLKENNLFGRTGKQMVVSLVVRGNETVVLSWLKSTIGEYVKDAHSVLMLEEISDEDEFRTTVFESFRAGGVNVNPDSDEVLHTIVSELELINYSSSGKGDLYPIDDEFMRLPKTLVGFTTLAISAVVASGTFIFSETLSNKQTSLMREERQLRNSKPNVEEFRREKIRNHVAYFIENRNINFHRAFEAAEKVWMPNSRIDLIVDRNSTTVRLFSTGGPGYLPQVFADLIHEQKAPEGFEKSDVVASNNYESFEVTYTKNGR